MYEAIISTNMNFKLVPVFEPIYTLYILKKLPSKTTIQGNS